MLHGHTDYFELKTLENSHVKGAFPIPEGRNKLITEHRESRPREIETHLVKIAIFLSLHIYFTFPQFLLFNLVYKHLGLVTSLGLHYSSKGSHVNIK